MLIKKNNIAIQLTLFYRGKRGARHICSCCFFLSNVETKNYFALIPLDFAEKYITHKLIKMGTFGNRK